jgi:hypothetical protein
MDLGCDASERFPRLNAHMGLEIFMGALAASNTNVRTMELGVQTEEPHAFLTGLPINVVVKACHKVETLVLRKSYHEFDGDGHYGREPRVILTQCTFPALRSLTIEGFSLNDEDDPGMRHAHSQQLFRLSLISPSVQIFFTRTPFSSFSIITEVIYTIESSKESAKQSSVQYFAYLMLSALNVSKSDLEKVNFGDNT